MQAEKWVLRRLSHLRRRYLPASPEPSSRSPAPLAAALSALWFVVCYAARVVLVYAWLWGLADYTFWKSTQSCRLEELAVPEIAHMLASARDGALRVAGSLQLGWSRW